MHGNVMEWCQDWYGSYSSGTVGQLTGPTVPRRGGAFNNLAQHVRAARRIQGGPTSIGGAIGFRLLRRAK